MLSGLEQDRARLRRLVAKDIAGEMSYEEVLGIMDEWNVFGNWDSYELENRPVDVDELSYLIYEELGQRTYNKLIERSKSNVHGN